MREESRSGSGFQFRFTRIQSSWVDRFGTTWSIDRVEPEIAHYLGVQEDSLRFVSRKGEDGTRYYWVVAGTEAPVLDAEVTLPAGSSEDSARAALKDVVVRRIVDRIDHGFTALLQIDPTSPYITALLHRRS